MQSRVSEVISLRKWLVSFIMILNAPIVVVVHIIASLSALKCVLVQLQKKNSTEVSVFSSYQ